MLLRPLFTGVLLIIFSAGISAQQVRSSLSSDTVSVGDIFSYSILLQLDDEYDKVIYPDTVNFPPSLEFRGKQQFRLSSFTDSTAFHFQFFANDDVTISELPLQLISDGDTTTLYTNAVTLHFRSLLAESDSTFRPMKPIYDFPRAWWPWILAVIAAAAFLIWWFRFRKKPEPAKDEPETVYVPFLNPLDELEESLLKIRQEYNPAETGDFKTYYSMISDSIRKYYEDLYKIPALESTSRELLRYLEAYGADKEMTDATRSVLLQSDLVKFAKFLPTIDDSQKVYQHAMDFLDRAKTADSTRISRMKERFEADQNGETQSKGAS